MNQMPQNQSHDYTLKRIIIYNTRFGVQILHTLQRPTAVLGKFMYQPVFVPVYVPFYVRVVSALGQCLPSMH